MMPDTAGSQFFIMHAPLLLLSAPKRGRFGTGYEGSFCANALRCLRPPQNFFGSG